MIGQDWLGRTQGISLERGMVDNWKGRQQSTSQDSRRMEHEQDWNMKELHVQDWSTGLLVQMLHVRG